jgi:hypothetical protein
MDQWLKREGMNDLLLRILEGLQAGGMPPGAVAPPAPEGAALGLPEGARAASPVMLPGYEICADLEASFPLSGGVPAKVAASDLDGFVSRWVAALREKYSRNWLKMADSSGLEKAPDS